MSLASKALCASLFFCWAGTVLATAASSSSYTITRSVIDGAGGVAVSASFEIHGTVGQTAAGEAVSAGYTLLSGFIAIPDTDGDTILDNVDNCLNDTNADQLDTDADTLGDACDPDDDNDGLTDAEESALGTNPLLADTDTDGLDDITETSAYGDPATYDVGFETDPTNPDTDGDGLIDGLDPWPLIAPDGDLAPYGAPDGIVNIADLMIAQRILRGDISIAPASAEMAHGDVYPPGAPDGVFDISDYMLIQKLVLD